MIKAIWVAWLAAAVISISGPYIYASWLWLLAWLPWLAIAVREFRGAWKS